MSDVTCAVAVLQFSLPQNSAYDEKASDSYSALLAMPAGDEPAPLVRRRCRGEQSAVAPFADERRESADRGGEAGHAESVGLADRMRVQSASVGRSRKCDLESVSARQAWPGELAVSSGPITSQCGREAASSRGATQRWRGAPSARSC